MITDEQVNAFINAFELNGGHFLGNNEFDNVRKALEAYERSKLVIDKSLPPKAGERTDGNWYSQYVYDPDNDAIIYYDSESDEYHKPNGSVVRDPSRYYLLPEFKE